MATLDKMQTKGAPAGNAKELIRVEYDFAVDGGAAGALDILTASDDLVITGFYARILTACTSTGSMTLDVGVKGGDTPNVGRREA